MITRPERNLVDNSRHLGWRRTRYLPHCDFPHLTQSLTFRLHDAVPLHELVEFRRLLIRQHVEPEEIERRVAYRRAWYEDRGLGACWLRQPEIGAMVERTLLHFDDSRYWLRAWCVMPNHVHAVVDIWDGYPLDRIMHSWKSYSAHTANELLNRRGAFWAEDYYDRYIRDWNHLETAIGDVEQNPVKAGLVARAEDWPWTSAGR